MSHYLVSDEHERKLFVGGLEKINTDEDGLKRCFQSYGKIVDCIIIRDQDRQSRGFGFILFENIAAINTIMTAKRNGATFLINGHQLEIKRALPKLSGGSGGASPFGNSLDRKVFVGGLPSTITEQKLLLYFTSYGRVNEVELLRDKKTSRSRGFAFVTFDDEDSAEKCIQRRHHVICKKMCEVKRAREMAIESKDVDLNPTRFNSENNQQENLQSPGDSDGGMSMSDVNKLIRQAFVLGKLSAQHTLVNGGTPLAPTSNMVNFSKISMNKQSASTSPLASDPPSFACAPPPAVEESHLVRLAQLFQGHKFDDNPLKVLLKNDVPAAATAPAARNATYPSISSYEFNCSKHESDYGPTKESGKWEYMPY